MVDTGQKCECGNITFKDANSYSKMCNIITVSPTQEVTKGPMSKTDTRYDPATDELGYNVGSEESKTYLDERPEMAGTKSTLAPSVKKLSQRELHERHGHIGVHPGCSLCS